MWTWFQTALPWTYDARSLVNVYALDVVTRRRKPRARHPPDYALNVETRTPAGSSTVNGQPTVVFMRGGVYEC